MGHLQYHNVFLPIPQMVYSNFSGEIFPLTLYKFSCILLTNRGLFFSLESLLISGVDRRKIIAS
jgi:hypothetical protein